MSPIKLIGSPRLYDLASRGLSIAWGKKPLQIGHYKFRALPSNLKEIAEQARPYASQPVTGKRVFFFSCTHKWTQHGAISGLALRGLGHEFTLGYVPYADGFRPVGRLELISRDLYTRRMLKPFQPTIELLSFFTQQPAASLPPALQEAVDQITFFDAQYLLQVEEFDLKEPLYLLRRERNNYAARVAYTLLQTRRPDVVIIPNGMILEFGAVYEVARHFNLPVVTYEFYELDNRVWLSQNSMVARQETLDDFWAVRKDYPFTDQQRKWVNDFIISRQSTTPGQSFARLYGQLASTQGGEQMRRQLGLDQRPVVVLPTNVLGDSMTLDRQIFSSSMTEWITRTLAYFAKRNDVQLVLRAHPGENLVKGPSITDTIRAALPDLPENIHIIGPRDPLNSYDLLEIANLGLAYTTTFGLEMTVRGIPVILGGKTHYRGRGFTLDPASWEAYFALLDEILPKLPNHFMTQEQLEASWKYAYAFFYEFGRPFPWHTYKLEKRIRQRPLSYVLSEAGRKEYGDTFRYFVGEPIDWKMEVEKETGTNVENIRLS
jgi:hypothetical protein